MRLQEELRGHVARYDDVGPIRHIAGADLSFIKSRNLACGGVIVYEFPSLREVERQAVVEETPFPYVPGLLSFREIPVLMRVFERLCIAPDLAIFDGQGIAHMRRMGLASHAGLVLDLPTIGCAKSRLIGRHDAPPNRVGGWTPLTDEGEVIGAVLRTRVGVKPVYVSTGHRVALATAVDILLKCLDRTRIPLPTREADRYVAQVKRDYLAGAT